jgi:hypothetical protein
MVESAWHSPKQINAESPVCKAGKLNFAKKPLAKRLLWELSPLAQKGLSAKLLQLTACRLRKQRSPCLSLNAASACKPFFQNL